MMTPERFTELRRSADYGDDHDRQIELSECLDEIVRLQSMVNRIPRAADGTRVIPTVDVLYVPFWGKVEVSLTVRDSNGFDVPVKISECYTRRYDSREAAEGGGK